MKKITKILVATDYSQYSDHAVHLAHDLHKKMGAEVTLVHVSDVSPVWDMPAIDNQARNLLGQFQQEMNKSLEKIMEEQKSRCNVKFESLIKFGNAQKELFNTINTTKADLLIMGHRGQTGFFGIGSFAEKMIAASPIPVLIAKNNKSFKKISCLIDPSKISQESVAYAKEFAHSFSTNVQILVSIADLSSESLINIPFVIPSYKFSEAEKMQIAENTKSLIMNHVSGISHQDVHVEISNLSTARALSQGLAEQKADLAIVTKHNRGALEKFFIGSVSKGILQEFDGNILVLPA